MKCNWLVVGEADVRLDRLLRHQLQETTTISEEVPPPTSGKVYVKEGQAYAVHNGTRHSSHEAAV